MCIILVFLKKISLNPETPVIYYFFVMDNTNRLTKGGEVFASQGSQQRFRDCFHAIYTFRFSQHLELTGPWMRTRDLTD